MPWWGIVILCLGCLEIGFLFGHAIGRENKYNENNNCKNEEDDIQET